MSGAQPAPDTYYASAERAAPDEVVIQREALLSQPLLRELVDASPEVVLVLNTHRQIVLANRHLQLLMGLGGDQPLVGRRPGEALGCVHSDEMPGGCGTSETCRTCGAVWAVVQSQQDGHQERECRITRRGEQGLEALDFKVWSQPLCLDRHRFTLFTLTDISDQKRRRVLERLFFHDILNTAGGLRGFVQLLRDEPNAADAQTLELILDTSEALIGEIEAHRMLMAAEANELTLQPAPLATREILAGMVRRHGRAEETEGRRVLLDPGTENLEVDTDRALLGRVLGNLVKNALEAVPPGAAVTVGCRRSGNGAEFTVHNPGAMPRDVQLQVFKRSFSTKGRDRGLGTYSVKLFSEKFLGGRVEFTSDEQHGTVFSVWLPSAPPSS